MQKSILIIIITTLLFACNNKTSNGKFLVNGNLKNINNQKIFLEELTFNKTEPVVLDTAEIVNGKFTLKGTAAEEGIYRLRIEKLNHGFLFINDNNLINFTADITDASLNGANFATAANSSFKNFIAISDSLMNAIQTEATHLDQLQKSGTKQTDSAVIIAEKVFNLRKEQMIHFCFNYSDTAQSPAMALFAATAAPVSVEEFQTPFQKLAKRFPKHNGIAAISIFAKQQLSLQQKQQQTQQGKIAIGSLAPEITMNDVNDKPFSLSQLKGKFVLLDFWASWCGPCRAENPNVVAAFNQFKDKNFTVLGVSLDKDKTAWLKAIKDDNLNWQHISDLQEWQSAAIGLYGFNAIPYNVLIDPQGKIIATELRGAELSKKLSEVLK